MEATQDVAVAEMHAVERADGDDAIRRASCGRPDATQASRSTAFGPQLDRRDRSATATSVAARYRSSAARAAPSIARRTGLP